MPGSFSLCCAYLPLPVHTYAAMHCTHSAPFVPGRKTYGGGICKRHYRQLEQIVRGIVLDWWEVQMGLGLVREEEGKLREMSRGDRE
jgi:hypothetical protein